jgi:hypothetical protein
MKKRLTREDTSIEARFEGHPVIEYGMAQIPNLLLKHYVHLELSDGHYALLSHIIGRKWTAKAPYPTLHRLPMSVSYDTRRGYVRDLRRRGLLFTKRLYWTKEDVEKYPQANPGRVRANLWYLGSLLHNLVRVDQWLVEGKPLVEFLIEIPTDTVTMFLNNEFHDVPKQIADHIEQAINNVGLIVPVSLPCEKHTVGLPCEKLPVEKLPVENHTVMNKNQIPNKNQQGDGKMDESAKFFGNNPNSNAVLPQAVDKHQRMVDAANGSQADDPVETVAGHHYQGFMEAPIPLPSGKKEREKWIQAAQRLLKKLPAGWELRRVCEAIDYWWVNTPDDNQFWTRMPCKDETLDLIAKYYIQRNTLQDEPPEEFSGAVDVPQEREKDPLEALWAAAMSELKLQMTKNTFDTLIRPTQALGRENGTLQIAVQSGYAKEWIDSRLKAMILRTLQGIQSEIEDVVFIAL